MFTYKTLFLFLPSFAPDYNRASKYLQCYRTVDCNVRKVDILVPIHYIKSFGGIDVVVLNVCLCVEEETLVRDPKEKDNEPGSHVKALCLGIILRAVSQVLETVLDHAIEDKDEDCVCCVGEDLL